MKHSAFLALVLQASLLAAMSDGHAQNTTAASGPTQSWNFQVYLDEKPIGSHAFIRYGQGKNYQMRIEADFQVKILFFTAYTYEHRNQEQWRDGCLQAIKSQTDDNGTLYTVTGQRNADAFEVVANQTTRQLPTCITSFAYWDPDFLNQTALLNSQTGEYLPVKISGPFSDTRVDRGNTVQAQRYRIKADKVDIKLWYSQSGDWLALESTLENDRTLRYLRGEAEVAE